MRSDAARPGFVWTRRSQVRSLRRFPSVSLGSFAPLGLFGFFPARSFGFSRHRALLLRWVRLVSCASGFRSLHPSIGPAGFVRSAGFVWILELPVSFGCSRHRVPFAPLGSFGFAAPWVCSLRGFVRLAGFIRSAGFVWILELLCSFGTGRMSSNHPRLGVDRSRAGAPPTDALKRTSADHVCTSDYGLPTARPTDSAGR
jgi:hypothetical protein